MNSSKGNDQENASPKKSPIHTICSQMSGFSYESARELADKEAAAAKSSKPALAGLMSALSHLCYVEKQYYSLSFLVKKRFAMTDSSLTTGYNQVINELKKVEEWRSSSATREMATLLINFAEARMDLMKIYEWIATTGASVALNEASALTPGPEFTSSKTLDEVTFPIEDQLITKLFAFAKKNRNILGNNETLEPLRDVFFWEVNALLGLIACLHHLYHYRYQYAVNEIDRTKSALMDWCKSLQTHKDTRSSSRLASWFRTASPTPSSTSSTAAAATPPPSSSAFDLGDVAEATEAILEDYEEEDQGTSAERLKDIVEPPMYTWLYRLRSHVLAKLTVYFYDWFKRPITEAQMRENCSRLMVDVPSKLQNGQKKLEISYVVFIFDASKEPDYKGPGAHHPAIKKEPPRGLDLYPWAFTYPEQPTELLPGLVMNITEYHQDLKMGNKIGHIVDPRMNITYYLMKIEPRMNFCCICQGKRGEKDANIINFMVEIAGYLRMNKIFASIKPGYKYQ